MRRYNSESHVLGATLTVIGVVMTLIWFGGRILFGILFNINCEGHLKRAADASTIVLAQQELDVAIKWLDDRGATKGYTSVIYTGPQDDVGFLYTNLTSARAELSALPENTTSLEKTNVLMKLRETLCDTEDGKTKVSVPSGLSIFPYNVGWALFGGISVLLLAVGVILWNGDKIREIFE